MLEDVVFVDNAWVELAVDLVSAYDTVAPSDDLFCSEPEPAVLVDSAVEEEIEVTF